jgi:hypothetical protein
MPTWVRTTLGVLREVATLGLSLAVGVMWPLVAWRVVVGPPDPSWDAGNNAAAAWFVTVAMAAELHVAGLSFLFARAFGRDLPVALLCSQLCCIAAATAMGLLLALN